MTQYRFNERTTEINVRGWNKEEIANMSKDDLMDKAYARMDKACNFSPDTTVECDSKEEALEMLKNFTEHNFSDYYESNNIITVRDAYVEEVDVDEDGDEMGFEIIAECVADIRV